MNKPLICPFLKSECKKEECMLFVYEKLGGERVNEECVFTKIGDELRNIWLND